MTEQYSMKDLKHKKVSYIELDAWELDKFFEKVYGYEYEIAANHEASNGTNLTFCIDGKIEKWNEESLEQFKQTGRMGGRKTSILLNDLARRGIIEEGEYIVSISW